MLRSMIRPYQLMKGPIKPRWMGVGSGIVLGTLLTFIFPDPQFKEIEAWAHTQAHDDH